MILFLILLSISACIANQFQTNALTFFDVELRKEKNMLQSALNSHCAAQVNKAFFGKRCAMCKQRKGKVIMYFMVCHYLSAF